MLTNANENTNLRASAASVIATVVQNNTSAQDKAVDVGVLAALVGVMNEASSGEGTSVLMRRALRAISCE